MLGVVLVFGKTSAIEIMILSRKYSYFIESNDSLSFTNLAKLNLSELLCIFFKPQRVTWFRPRYDIDIN